LDNVQNFCQVGSIHGHIRPLKKDYILLISDKGETYFTVQLHSHIVCLYRRLFEVWPNLNIR